jgi:TolB-like protein/Flp pilus assembly protein TadD
VATSELSRAVFLSYASEDSEAATRICEGLRAAGIEVWFDKSELRGGDAWDRQIRERIRDCRLFIPVISAATETRDEGYFRREWSLAVDRTRDMSEKRTFLVPVVVDGTSERGASVPERFRDVQWTSLPAGQTTPAFVSRIAALLGQGHPVPAASVHVESHPSVLSPEPRPRTVWPLVTLAAAVLVAAVGWLLVRRADTTVPVPPSPRSTISEGRSPANSVAVLPFVDMSEKHDQEVFSDGLSEELIDVLTKLPGLRVPARTSSFSFKGKSVTIGEIARVLGVVHVLEGSVRKAGNRMRVTAQLVRADDGFHEWSETYDRDVQDVFAVQDDIARSVAEQLNITLQSGAAQRASVSADAYGLYLQGRFRLRRDTADDLDASVELFQRAIGVAPDFAAAWAWLAYCQTRRIANGDTNPQTHAQVEKAAERAITLDPDLAEGYIAAGLAALQRLDWAKAERFLDQALQKDPNNPLALQFRGHLTQAIDGIDDAERYMRRAIDLDPLNPLHRRYLARVVLNSGRAAESAAILRQAIAESPNFPALHYELARALLVQGKVVDADRALQGETADVWAMLGKPVIEHAMHRDDGARTALARLVANSGGSEFQVAEAYASLGQADRAFEWLDHARERHDAGVMYVRRDPLLASLFSDPRYKAFLRTINLPE